MSFKDALVSLGILNRRTTVLSPQEAAQARSEGSSRVRYSVVHDPFPTAAEAAQDLKAAMDVLNDPEMVKVLGSPGAVANAVLLQRHNLVRALGLPTQQQIDAQLQKEELQRAIEAYSNFPDALHGPVTRVNGRDDIFFI